jgi:hypothetical protein
MVMKCFELKGSIQGSELMVQVAGIIVNNVGGEKGY